MNKPGKVTSRIDRKARGGECLECDRLADGATRERVRYHVAQTGHAARFVVEYITTYSVARP